MTRTEEELVSEYALLLLKKFALTESALVWAAVTNRIRDAIQLIRKELPDLGEHLGRCVKTGATCAYEATSPKRWLL